MKKIGIIGITGKVGSILKAIIEKDNKYILGSNFSKSISDITSIDDVFKNNDYVIDFSSKDILNLILDTALKNPKPLILCTTGWSIDDKIINEKINCLSKKTSLVIAQNTSMGSLIQKKISSIIANILNNEYDIEIAERHHKNKIDSPSGTAILIAKEISKVKNTNKINILSSRVGNVFGEHKITFTNNNEEISIKHTVFNRFIFAEGAIKIVEWIDTNKICNGKYEMSDIIKI